MNKPATLNLASLEQSAGKVYSAALASLGFKYETRQQLANALVATAKAAGFAPREALWIASRGLSWSGFGGGL